MYKRSFEGLLFYENGRYKKQMENETIGIELKQAKAANLALERRQQVTPNGNAENLPEMSGNRDSCGRNLLSD